MRVAHDRAAGPERLLSRRWASSCSCRRRVRRRRVRAHRHHRRPVPFRGRPQLSSITPRSSSTIRSWATRCRASMACTRRTGSRDRSSPLPLVALGALGSPSIDREQFFFSFTSALLGAATAAHAVSVLPGRSGFHVGRLVLDARRLRSRRWRSRPRHRSSTRRNMGSSSSPRASWRFSASAPGLDAFRGGGGARTRGPRELPGNVRDPVPDPRSGDACSDLRVAGRDRRRSFERYRSSSSSSADWACCCGPASTTSASAASCSAGQGTNHPSAVRESR